MSKIKYLSYVDTRTGCIWEKPDTTPVAGHLQEVTHEQALRIDGGENFAVVIRDGIASEAEANIEAALAEAEPTPTPADATAAPVDAVEAKDLLEILPALKSHADLDEAAKAHGVVIPSDITKLADKKAYLEKTLSD